MNFSENLKQIRSSKNITQKQLADYLGITVRTIVNYENGSREPKLLQLVSIAKFLDVSTDHLLGVND